MPNREILENIKNSIASGKEQAAIELLKNYCSERKYEDLHRSVLAISGNLQTLILKERNHTIAVDDAMIEHNKIKERLLEITQEAERYADANYRRNKNLKEVKNKASKGIPLVVYLFGIAILLGGLFYIGNHFFHKSTAQQNKINEKKDSLTIIGGDLQKLPMTQAAPVFEQEEKEPEALEVEQIQTFYDHRILAEDHPYRAAYKFPVIDFKFHNKGNAQAYINAFYVDVLEYEVDETAIMKMNFSINPKQWDFVLENTGWGTAKNCNCQIENEQFAQVFDTDLLQFEQDIEPTDELVYKREIVHSLLADSADFSFIAASEIEINKENTQVKCIYFNKGETKELNFPFYGYPVYLDTIGFRKEYSSAEINSAVVYRAANYLLYINEEEKTYAQDILHDVDADDLHRFQITIGSRQSCKVKLQFRFITNDERELKSEPFEVEIWRPKRVEVPGVQGNILNVINS